MLSSTSSNVFESYNGNEIIRSEGKAETKEFIYRFWTEEDRGSYDILGDLFDLQDFQQWVFGLKEAHAARVIRSADVSLLGKIRRKIRSVHLKSCKYQSTTVELR